MATKKKKVIAKKKTSTKKKSVAKKKTSTNKKSVTKKKLRGAGVGRGKSASYSEVIAEKLKDNKRWPRKELFPYEYMKVKNRTKAAIACGYSANTARTAGARLFADVALRAKIEELQQRQCEETMIDANWVLLELKKLHEVSLADFLEIPEDGGTPYYDFRKATKQQLAALEMLQIDITKIGGMSTTKIKIAMAKKLDILNTIGKHVGVNAFKDTVDVNASITLKFDSQDEDA